MNKYSIQYHSKTLVALADREKQQTFPLPGWVFNYPNLPNCELTIALSDSVKKTDNVNLHTGLNIVADIKADSEEDARETSKNFVETLLNLVSFSTLTYCNSATLVSIIKIDKEAHPFRYYLYPFEEQEIIGALIQIDELIFKAIFKAYDKCSYKSRILRALTWLRKGIGEESVVDEFVSYWIGLEVIKHVLSPEKMNTDKEWDKVEEVFTNSLHFQDFKRIKQDGRNGLLHGFQQLDSDFVKEIEDYVEPIRKTLIYCIGSILGLEDSIILAIINKTPRRIKQNPWTVVEGVLRNIPKDFAKLAENYPMIDCEKVNKKFSIDKKGELSITFPVTYRFHGPSDAKWEVKATELWGDKDAGIKHTDFKG